MSYGKIPCIFIYFYSFCPPTSIFIALTKWPVPLPMSSIFPFFKAGYVLNEFFLSAKHETSCKTVQLIGKTFWSIVVWYIVIRFVKPGYFTLFRIILGERETASNTFKTGNSLLLTKWSVQLNCRPIFSEEQRGHTLWCTILLRLRFHFKFSKEIACE